MAETYLDAAQLWYDNLGPQERAFVNTLTEHAAEVAESEEHDAHADDYDQGFLDGEASCDCTSSYDEGYESGFDDGQENC